MKFLIITKAKEGIPAPDNYNELLKAAKTYIEGKLADGTLDCVYQVLGKLPSKGIAIGNADSFEKIMEDIMSYPLFNLLDWKIKPLMDAIKLMDMNIAALG
ncbi:MAG: hypothetical protein ACXAD7_05340 [Candidatus Kariarchaeaceae archaeon]|jgi:hypothetical protein